MDRFFKSLKPEWIPTTAYQSFSQSKTNIIDYKIGYYRQFKNLINTTMALRQMLLIKLLGGKKP